MLDVYSALARVGGVILVLAGVIKLATGEMPNTTEGFAGQVFPSWILAIVPHFEVGLGAWLSSRRFRYGAWLTTIATLIIFSLHNLSLVSAEQSSCGCLGAWSPTPGIMLALDVAALMMLLKWRPGWPGWPTDSPLLRTAVTAGSAAGLVLLSAAGVAYIRYGSIPIAMADIRGDTVALTNSDVNLGTAPPGEIWHHTVRIQNLTGGPVEVQYARSNCNCANFEGLPLTLPANSHHDLSLTVQVSELPGTFRRAGLLRTTAGDVTFILRGRVRGEAGTVARVD